MPDENDHTPNLPHTENTSRGGLPAGLLKKLRIRIPGYKLLGVVGSGGQATVYKAIEETSGMTVAVKLLHSGTLADDGARERLRLEVQAMKALEDCRNIVCAFDSGQTVEGHDYLVMNYVDGKPLDEFWKNRKPPPDTEDAAWQLKLFIRICKAVNVAHMRGITHRDLSPSNILVDGEGEPHILDFGLARTAPDSISQSRMTNLSVTGQFLGKLAYASPEQARGKPSEIDIRTDVYSLGVILYQIVTHGRFPYEVVGSLVDVLNNIIMATPTPPSQAMAVNEATQVTAERTLRTKHPPAVNKSIEAIVLMALEKRADDRYQNAGELAGDIERYLSRIPTVAGEARRSRDKSIDIRAWRSSIIGRICIRSIGPLLVLGITAASVVISHKAKSLQTGISAASATTSTTNAIRPTTSQGGSQLPPTIQIVQRTPTTSKSPADLHLPGTPIPPVPDDTIKKTPAELPRTVDLMKLVRLDHDVVEGAWDKRGDDIVTSDGEIPALRFGYIPPEEYDFTIEFTISEIKSYADVRQMISADGASLGVIFGAFHNSKNMLSSVNGEEPQFDGPLLETNHRYNSTIKVRRTEISVFLDGKQLWSIPTLNNRFFYAAAKENGDLGLGIGTYNTISLQAAYVKEIGSVGRAIRRMDFLGIREPFPPATGQTISAANLNEVSSVVGLGTFIANVERKNRPVLVKGKRCTSFIQAFAPSSVVYDIPPGAVGFRATGVAPAGDFPQDQRTWRYLVYVDGDEAFVSRSLAECNGEVPIEVPIPAGAKRIELRVDDLGDNNFDAAIWTDPEFVLAPGKHYVQVLQGHPEVVAKIQFLPDDKLMAIGAMWDPHAVTWNLNTGEIISTTAPRRNSIYSPDGQWVFSPGVLVSTATGRKWKIDSDSDADRAVFSADGSRVAVSPVWQNAPVRVYRCADGAKLFQTPAPDVACCTFDLSPDGHRVMATGGGRGLQVWDVDTGNEFPRAKWEAGTRIWSHFSLDGNQLGAVHHDYGLIAVTDIASGKRLATAQASSNRKPDGRKMYVASNGFTAAWVNLDDNSVGLVTTGRDGTRSGSVQNPAPVTCDPVLSPDGTRLLTSTADNVLRLFDTLNYRQIAEFKGHSAKIIAIAFSPDGRFAASGGVDKTVRIWGVSDEALRGDAPTVSSNLPPPPPVPFDKPVQMTETITAIAPPKLLDRIRILAPPEWIPPPRVLPQRETSMVIPTRPHDRFAKIAFSADGGSLISSPWANTMEFSTVWNLSNGNATPLQLPGFRTCTSDGQWMCINYTPETKEISRSVFDGRGQFNNDAAFSADGHRLVLARTEKKNIQVIYVFRVAMNRLVQEQVLLPDWKYTCGVAVSADGSRIAATGGNQTRQGVVVNAVKVWDFASQAQLPRLPIVGGNQIHFQLSADGKQLCWVNDPRGQVDIYDTDTGSRAGGVLNADDAKSGGWRILPGAGIRLVRWADKGRVMSFWDGLIGKHIGSMKLNEPLCAEPCFSADGNLMLIAQRSGVTIWDTRNFTVLARSEDCGDAVSALALSADGKLAAAGNVTPTSQLIWTWRVPLPDDFASAKRRPSNPAGIQIISAEWGGKGNQTDVASKVATLCNQRQEFVVNDQSLGAPPVSAQPRHLDVRFVANGEQGAFSFSDGSKVQWSDYGPSVQTVSSMSQANNADPNTPVEHRGGIGKLPAVALNPTSVVYLADANGSILSEFGELKQDLKTGISSLAPEQRFNVLFFQGDAVQTFLPGNLGPASANLKAQASRFVDSAVAEGQTLPLQAIKTALALKPELLYFLSDGMPTVASWDDVVEAFRLRNPDGSVKVICIVYREKPRPLSPSSLEAIKQIARDGHGLVKFVEND